MRDPALILVVDDNEANRDILETRLVSQGYKVITANDGEEGIEKARAELPDLVLLDVMMPKLDGFEVCRRLKADESLPFLPIILVTAKADIKDIVRGLELGADEYLTKPLDHAALVARVRSILRIKALHDTVQAQAKELADWNRTLEQRVEAQVGELERVGRLKRFLPRQVADLITSSGDEKLLSSHRREITVMFCDMRGFTGFAELAEPEEVMQVLHAFHDAAGKLIDRYEGTLERFLGDGIMVLFNDPVPCPDPAARAVKLGVDLRSAFDAMSEKWKKFGHQLGFGIGIAHGYATLGRIGYDGRADYTAIGTVVNLAARLCAEAKAGEILLSQRAAATVEELVEVEPAGELSLKGLRQPVAAFRLLGSKTV